MRLAHAQPAVVAGIVLALAAVAAMPIAAHAQITCAPGTGVLVRPVGSSSAPILVPAQVHLTICSDRGTVIAVMPAYQNFGPASAPIMIPTPSLVKTCAPAVIATTPASGAGLTPALQFTTVGTNVVAIPVAGGGTVTVPTIPVATSAFTTLQPVAVITPVVVTSAPTAFTCF
jgi:hypothetical protein